MSFHSLCFNWSLSPQILAPVQIFYVLPCWHGLHRSFIALSGRNVGVLVIVVDVVVGQTERRANGRRCTTFADLLIQIKSSKQISEIFCRVPRCFSIFEAKAGRNVGEPVTVADAAEGQTAQTLFIGQYLPPNLIFRLVVI